MFAHAFLILLASILFFGLILASVYIYTAFSPEPEKGLDEAKMYLVVSVAFLGVSLFIGLIFGRTVLLYCAIECLAFGIVSSLKLFVK